MSAKRTAAPCQGTAAQSRAAAKPSDTAIIPSEAGRATTTPHGKPSLAARRRAAFRLPPTEGRYGPDLAARDPLLPWPAREREPSTYSLPAQQRVAYARDLLASGWARWEIQVTLVDPAVAA